MVFLFDLTQIQQNFIPHKGAKYTNKNDQIEVSIKAEDNHYNSTGILLPWRTSPGSTYRLKVKVSLSKGDRAFIFGETGDFQTRLIPRDYWVYPDKPLEVEILFQAISETSILGVLFNRKDMDYKVLVEQFELSQTRNRPESYTEKIINMESLEPKFDKNQVKKIKKKLLPVPKTYEIPIEALIEETRVKNSDKIRPDFFHPNPPEQIKQTGLKIKRFAPWFEESTSLFNNLADRIFVIKWNNQQDWMDVQMKIRNLEYYLVQAIRSNPEKYRQLVQTRPPSFSINHPDPDSLAQTETFIDLLKYARRQKLKRVMIISDTDLIFQDRSEERLKRILQQKIVEKTSAFFLHMERSEDLTLLQQNKVSQVPYYLIESGNNGISKTMVLDQGLYNEILDSWEQESFLNFNRLVENIALKHQGIVVAYPNLLEKTEFSDYQEWLKEFDNQSVRQLLFDLPLELGEQDLKDSDFPEPESGFQSIFDLLRPGYQKTNNKINKFHLINLIEGRDPAIAVIIPSYNNKENYQKNLRSVFEQNYRNYRIIYVDDCSTDKTFDLVQDLIKSSDQPGRCLLLKQRTNQKQGASRYIAYHQTDPDEILILLDGDDWLAHEHVFRIVADSYLKTNIWASYGSFYKHTGQKTHWEGLSGLGTFPPRIIERKMYRQFRWTSQHLRTGLSCLFQKIIIDDLWDQTGRFLHTCTDLAESFPLLEMAGTRHQNLKQGLYVYNQDNSTQYQHSFYNLRKRDNRNAKVYHDTIIRNFKKIEPYQTVPRKIKYQHYLPNKISLNLVIERANWNSFKDRFPDDWQIVRERKLVATKKTRSKRVVGIRGHPGPLGAVQDDSGDPLQETFAEQGPNKHRIYVYLTDGPITKEICSSIPLTATRTVIVQSTMALSRIKLSLKWMTRPGIDAFHFISEKIDNKKVFVCNELTIQDQLGPRVQAFSYNQKYMPRLSLEGVYRTRALRQRSFKVGLRVVEPNIQLFHKSFY